MKKRLIAVLLLLAFALAACASESAPEKSGKEPKDMHRSEDAAEGAGEALDVDTGVIDGNTYKHVGLGLSAAFPEDWTLSDDSELAEMNGMDAATYDRAAILDAVNGGQTVAVFSAHDDTGMTYALIRVSLNPLPAADPDSDDFVNHFAPLVRKEYNEVESWDLVACDPIDVDFCGEDHVALSITQSGGDLQRYLKHLYLPCGDLLYTLTVSSDQETVPQDVLDFFATLG